jgi:hypothetical protein
MSFIQTKFLRSIQPIFIRTIKTSTTGSGKNPPKIDDDDDHFLA